MSAATQLRTTSTPKSSREPLRERRVSATAVERTRRALAMVEEDGKENHNNNDDSAVGLNASGVADCTKSLSPPTSTSSKASSKTSSPDSGASSGSPKSFKGDEEEGVEDIDTLLGSTRISPLAKSNR